MHNTAENGTSKPRPCFDDDATKNKDRRRRSEKAIEHTGFTVSAFVNDLKREVSRITSEANHESIASRIMCHDTRPLSFVRPSVVPIITTNPNDHPSQQLSCRRLIFYRVVSFSFADSTLSRARLYSPSVSIILLASLTWYYSQQRLVLLATLHRPTSKLLAAHKSSSSVHRRVRWNTRPIVPRSQTTALLY